MNHDEVIERYVLDVIGRLPRRQRDEIGFELRGLLGEMLEGDAAEAGRIPDEAMVLAMLRRFGTPADVASRYREPGMLVIPAEGTRGFTIAALVGIALQWALTLPLVFDGQQGIAAWWLSWGLGALWWPGFMAMMSLLGTWLQSLGWFKTRWNPRTVDSDRVNRTALAIALVWFAIGVALMTALPWIVPKLPGVLPRVLEFDPDFLRRRAPFALLLWAVSFASLVMVWIKGRWTRTLRRVETVGVVGFILLMGWWLMAGRMFVADATEEGARGALCLVIAIMVIERAWTLYRGRVRIRGPRMAGQPARD